MFPWLHPSRSFLSDDESTGTDDCSSARDDRTLIADLVRETRIVNIEEEPELEEEEEVEHLATYGDSSSPICSTEPAESTVEDVSPPISEPSEELHQPTVSEEEPQEPTVVEEKVDSEELKEEEHVSQQETTKQQQRNNQDQGGQHRQRSGSHNNKRRGPRRRGGYNNNNRGGGGYNTNRGEDDRDQQQHSRDDGRCYQIVGNHR
eukprot:sb/3470485/